MTIFEASELSKLEAVKLPIAKRFVHDLAAAIHEKRLEGKALYSLSVTYTESKEFPITQDAANRYFQSFHHQLLQHLAGTRHIERNRFRAIDPEIHAFVDIPASKPKSAGTIPTRLSTFHHHAVLIADQSHRAKLDELMNQTGSSQLFANTVGQLCRVRSFHIVPIGPDFRDITRVVDYASSHARRSLGKDAWDSSYIVLPA